MNSRFFISTLLFILILLVPHRSHADMRLAVSSPVIIGNIDTSTTDQLFPQVAYGNKSFLVVWQQGRNYYQGPTANIYAVLLDESGNLIKGPFKVCSSRNSQEKPRVVFNNNTFLIVWQDFRNGNNWDIYAARLSSDGNLLESDGFKVAGGNRNQALPAVAAAEKGFLVAWQDFSDGAFYKIHTSFVTDNGQTTRTAPIVYNGTDKPGFWGYTPAWGYDRSPLRMKETHNFTLTGGNIALATSGAGWIIAWNDKSNWTTSGDGVITGRFAYLKRQGDHLIATKIRRSPSTHLGDGTGNFAVSNKSLSMYAGWSIAGKGKSNRVGTSVLFDAGTISPLLNPNTETKRNWSGWRTETMIPLFFRPIAVESPVAITFGHNIFFAAAISPYTNSRPPVQKIYGMGVTTQGNRIYRKNYWPVIHESEKMLSNPALSSGKNGFLLVFQQEDTKGNNSIWRILIKAD